MIRTNVYGPRPDGCGFRCDGCGSQEYPLYGYTPARKEDRNTYTRCVACLKIAVLRGGGPMPTMDALEALDRQGAVLPARERGVLR